jgi:hypothetical protein
LDDLELNLSAIFFGDTLRHSFIREDEFLGKPVGILYQLHAW